jgi:hypothetical protein
MLIRATVYIVSPDFMAKGFSTRSGSRVPDGFLERTDWDERPESLRDQTAKGTVCKVLFGVSRVR